MKNFFTLIVVIVMAIPSFAQDKSDVSNQKNVIKANAMSLVFATGSVFYEHKISDMTSAQLGFAYCGFKISNTKFNGLVLTPEFRIYPQKNAIDGFYLAPYLRYQNYNLEVNTDKATLSSMGGGLLFGRQWITKSGFTMDLFFGGHYGSSNLKVESGEASDFKTNLFSRYGVRIGFAMGFAF